MGTGRAALPAPDAADDHDPGAARRDGRAGHRRGGAQHQPLLVQGGPRRRDQDHPDPEREARRGLRGRTRTASSPSPPWRCSIPISPPSSSRRASRSTACAAPPSAAASTARRSAIRSSTRSGPRPSSSACWCSSIRRARAELEQPRAGFKGNGCLDNVIGNPLETTIALSHLIFEGTLDRFPGLKICAAHGGGYLPSYAGALRRRRCLTFPGGAARDRSRRSRPSTCGSSTTTRSCSLRRPCATWPPRPARGQIVMGTDYPVPVDEHVGGPHPRHAGPERRRRVAMLGGTAAKLLKI